MIKGFRFTNQLANAEVDARIHQEFLNKNDGIFYGMELSYTSNSITVAEGLCEIAGRPIAVIDSETVNVGTENLYCLLILEIDLSKDSTKDVFNQASFKLLTSSTSYPTVTQQDINMYNGSNNLYQLEFARFKSGTGGITEFKDTRKFLSFSGIYAQIKADCDTVMNEIKQELKNVKDGSDYLLKSTGGTVEGKIVAKGGMEGNVTGNCSGNATTATTAENSKKLNGVAGSEYLLKSSEVVYDSRFVTIIGTIEMPAANDAVITGATNIKYPNGFNNNNCIIISLMSHNTLHNDWWSTSSNSKYSNSMIKGSGDLTATLKSDNIAVSANKVNTEEDGKDVTFKITLMKLPEYKEGTHFKLGDVNGNGVINGEDFNLLNSYMQGNSSLTLQQLKAADINKDGKIDAMDSYKLQQYIANGTPFE